MALSDDTAAHKTDQSVSEVCKQLDAGHLTVLGLIYHDFHETIAVWDNHQVLAHGYSLLADGTVRIMLYDPNFPNDDGVYLECASTEVMQGKKQVKARSVDQYRDGKKLYHLHGFFVVPYKPETPPDDLS